VGDQQQEAKYLTPSSDDVPEKSFDKYFDDARFLADRKEHLELEKDDEVPSLSPPTQSEKKKEDEKGGARGGGQG
jgi:hypothetical protein